MPVVAASVDEGQAREMAINLSIERAGRAFHARADGGQPFFIGFQTSYKDKSSGTEFEGLYNVPAHETPNLDYAPVDAVQSGFWAEFIAPTARCEGGNYLTLNTYDRARFTWGFGQFGAHVPDGDFVLFFRDMLQRPEAGDYFPNLALKDGRILKVSGDQSVALETATTTVPLMDYLNPTSSAVEDAEVIAAAKLIHWTTSFPAARELQAHHMIGTFKRLMRESDLRLGLDGRPADVCCVVCDIRHQGRAKYAAMQDALAAAQPLEALLMLGSIAYAGRIKTLRAALAASPSFAGKTWSRSAGAFT
jgi:hypothetical protein